MPIYLRKGVYYVDIRTESGRRIRQSAGTKNKQEAQRLHNKLTYELWQHEHFDEKPKRLWEEAAVKWIEENGSKKSIGNDLCRLRGLPELRGIYLHHLTRDFIMDTVAKKNCSDSTKNRYLALIRAILNKAVKEWGWLERAPHLTLYREPKRRIRWLTKDEANRLIASLPDYMAEMVIFSLSTGLRQRNVLDLEWQQVDLTGRTAWIHPDESKSGKAIGVALNDTAIGVISRQMGKHSRFVFTYSNGRKVQSISSRIWKNALEKAGILISAGTIFGTRGQVGWFSLACRCPPYRRWVVGKALRWYAVTHICRRNIFKPMPRYWTESGYVKTQIGHSADPKKMPSLRKSLILLVGPVGFEPTTKGL